MTRHQLKLANTRKLFKRLLLGCVLIAVYDLLLIDNVPPKADLGPFAVATATNASKHTENNAQVHTGPFEVSMSLSFNVDLGEALNKLIREFPSLR
jgi:hypothetical protein